MELHTAASGETGLSRKPQNFGNFFYVFFPKIKLILYKYINQKIDHLDVWCPEAYNEFHIYFDLTIGKAQTIEAESPDNHWLLTELNVGSDWHLAEVGVLVGEGKRAEAQVVAAEVAIGCEANVADLSDLAE